VNDAPPRLQAPGEPPALSLRHFSKRFGGAHALDEVSLDVVPGEVLGLLGQNGSGKSTLIKILAGYHEPEPGAELLIHGEAVTLPLSAGATERLGLAFVHQHLGLAPSLTVLENLRAGAIASHTRWWVNWREEHRRARKTFARFGLNINTHARVADLPQVERALVAIVRAFEALEQLFALVRAIVGRGAAVIFVSHDVDEIMQITDRATVLRDGRLAGTLVTKQATHADFVELIVGHRVEMFQTSPRDLSAAPLAASVRDVHGGALVGVSADVRRGEILGLAGLIGSGFDDLPYLLCGARPALRGTVRLDDLTERPLRDISPAAAVAAGIVLLPADRLGAAGVAQLSVADNVSLPVLPEFRSLLLNWQAIFERVVGLGQEYQVRPNDPAMALAALSGGNQQKVLLAKWLQTRPRLLLLDEPTQGVDVGARQHVFAAISAASVQGVAIVMASTDYEQLEQICDRVLIFARGVIAAELVGSAITKANIAEHCLRGAADAPPGADPLIVRGLATT
jgi:ribose transport system ATP-binding protein